MNRSISDKTLLERFAIDFTNVVQKFCKYIIVSGFVAISHGRSRGTEDIDMIIEKIDEKIFAKMHNALEDAGFECMQSKNSKEIYTDYLKEGMSVRYVKKGEFLPEMELKMAKDALDAYQIKTRKKLPLTGLELYFSSIEMNIAFKEELLKSDKDVEDARYLRVLYKNNLNGHEINEIKKMIRKLRLEK